MKITKKELAKQAKKSGAVSRLDGQLGADTIAAQIGNKHIRVNFWAMLRALPDNFKFNTN